jgi:hypothetical protein
VFAVASDVHTSTTGQSNEATISTLVSLLLGALSPIKSENPANLIPPAAPESKPVPPTFVGLDLLYSVRPSDENSITDVFKREQLVWRQRTGDTPDRSNVVTCGSQKSLEAAKTLAKWLIDVGVPIKAIAPQASPVFNRVTVEYYPEYERQPPISKDEIDGIGRCPLWSEVLSSRITVVNSCNYGFLDVYLRYYHPFKKRWITTFRYALGPKETWQVADENGLVGSAKPYVLASAIVNYNATDPYAISPENSLDLIPNDFFAQTPPVYTYSCPSNRGSYR